MKNYIHTIICLCVCAILMVYALPVYVAGHSTGSFNGGGRSSKVSSMPTVVSLGDSYSAGEGITPYYDQYENSAYKYTSEDWIAHRSTLAWPGLLEFNGVQLKDVRATNLGVFDDRLHPAQGIDNGSWYFAAVSGAVCDNIYSESEENRQSKTVNQLGSDLFGTGAYKHGTYTLDFQLKAIESLPDPSSVDYVTLTIGGNDVGFKDILLDAVLHCKYINLSGSDLLERILGELETFWSTTDGVPLADKLENTYRKILEKAESATLIVAGYPQLIYTYSYSVEDSSGNTQLIMATNSLIISYTEARLINSAVKIFNGYIEEIISRRMNGCNVVFVDVQDAFKGHEAYTTDDIEFINGLKLGFNENVDISGFGYLVNSASFHPTDNGARAYAKAVQDVLKSLERERLKEQSEEQNETQGNEFDYYQQALQKLEESDSFVMDMSVKTVSNITQGKTKAKVTTHFNASCTLEDYGTDNMTMTGSATLTGGGLDYAYDMSYKNGIAYYDYTKPAVDSVSMEMPFDLMQFDAIEESAITYARGGTSLNEEIKLVFSVDGEAVTKRGAEIIPQIMGSGYDVSYGDIEMTVLIDQESGELKSITMDFDTSITASDYKATATNEAVYTFTIDDENPKESANDTYKPASEYILASGTCGENLTWALDNEGTLTISGTGAMVNYGYTSVLDGAPWYDKRSDIKTVVVNSGVTTIGDFAFSHCTNLTSVVIPDSVTVIGAGAFWSWTGLTDVYYAGSESQWWDISINRLDVDSIVLDLATMHYNQSEIKG